MKYFAVFAFILLSCCADIQTQSLLSMNFEEVEDRDITVFRGLQAVEDNNATANTPADAPLKVQEGRLIVRDAVFIADESVALFEPASYAADRYSYLLTGEIEEGGRPDGGSVIFLTFKIPQPPRRPYTVATVELRTVDTPSGRRMVSVRDRRTDTEIALAPLGRPFGLIVTFDVASEEFTVGVPGASSTDSSVGGLMAYATVRQPPWLYVSALSPSAITLEVKSLDVLGITDLM